MLFEQVARRLIDIEEHEYTLATDEVAYVASCQSRFNKPEFIAVLGDVVVGDAVVGDVVVGVAVVGVAVVGVAVAGAAAEPLM